MDVSRTAGDDDKVLRALARDVVWYEGGPAAHETGPGPEFVAVPAERVEAPVAQGQDGRSYLLVFSSRAALVAHCGAEARRHVQVPAGQLFELLPDDLPVLVNPSGPRLLVLEPQGVRTVVALYRGQDVPAAFLPGPATGLLLAPLDDAHAELPSRLHDVAARTAVITGLWAGRAVLDEPGARPCLVVTAQVRDDVDVVDLDAAMQVLVAATEASTQSFTWVRPVRGEDSDGVLDWLRENTPQLAGR